MVLRHTDNPKGHGNYISELNLWENIVTVLKIYAVFCKFLIFK